MRVCPTSLSVKFPFYFAYLGRGYYIFCFLFFAVNARCNRVVYGWKGGGYRWPFSGTPLCLVVVLVAVVVLTSSVVSCSVASASDVTVYGSVRVCSECLRSTARLLSGAITPRIGAARKKSNPHTRRGSTWWIAHLLGNVLV